MKPHKMMKEYNSGLEEYYVDSLPKWMQFLMFVRRGIYNGKSNARYSRILCWFNRHEWGAFEYGVVRKHYQCKRCGMPSEDI